MKRPYRLGVLTTHPIQYQVPWFRLLAADPDIELTVYYCMIPDAAQQGAGFGVAFEWDLPLLDGYPYEVLENVAAKPGVTHRSGCDTPGIDRIVRDGKWDAFIVNGWVVRSCLQVLQACRRHRVPCLVRGEANDLRVRPWWVRLLHRRLLARYAGFLYIGEANRRFYLNNGVAEDRLFPALYGVDNERFLRAAEAREGRRAALREGFGLKPDQLALMFCGKFETKKRPMDVLEALTVAKAMGAALPQILMVGDGELREACEQKAAMDGLPVQFTGFLNQGEIVDAYIASDALVLPSDTGETWGLVVNEAMVCGRPALVSDQVGCHENLVVPGETGDSFRCGDINDLANKMVEWSGKADTLPTMGNKAREQVAAYGMEQVAAGVKRALTTIR